MWLIATKCPSNNNLSHIFTPQADAQRGLEILDSIPLQYVNVDMANVLSIAAQVNAYAYDAYLLDCALRHAAPLLTLDRTLRRAANALGINLVNLEG